MAFSASNILTCPNCDEDFEEWFEFPDRVETRQDITEDDVIEQTTTCPECEYSFPVSYSGWVSHDDAG